MTKAKSDESIMIILHQLMHLSEYQAMRGLDLKPGQAGILFWLGREGELSQRRLAEKLGITPPSVTTALRKLEAKGLIGKEGDPADQRIQRIHLTEAGKEMLGELKRIVGEMEQVIFRGISQEEKLLLLLSECPQREAGTLPLQSFEPPWQYWLSCRYCPGSWKGSERTP